MYNRTVTYTFGQLHTQSDSYIHNRIVTYTFDHYIQLRKKSAKKNLQKIRQAW